MDLSAHNCEEIVNAFVKMIQNSLEWEEKRSLLKEQILNLPYNKDLRTLLKNIDSLVKELSNAEVIARRHNKNILELAELKKVNESIDFLEKWIIMGALIGN